MPTPPTFTQPSYVIGSEDDNAHSTWGKLRSPIVSEYFNFTSGNNSLNVEAGFHPDDCYFVRCTGWPSSEEYLDENNVLQTGYSGLITGYVFTPFDPPEDPGTSTTALGAYDTALGYYFNTEGLGNRLDLYDREDFFDGMTINGSYTADNNYYGDEYVTNFYQEFQNTSINGDTVYTVGPLNTLSGLTAF